MIAPQKVKIELAYDLAIPLLGIYPKKKQKQEFKKIFVHLCFISIISNSQKMEATKAILPESLIKEIILNTDGWKSLSFEMN